MTTTERILDLTASGFYGVREAISYVREHPMSPKYTCPCCYNDKSNSPTPGEISQYCACGVGFHPTRQRALWTGQVREFIG